jgi:hypothetical protein
MQDRPTAAELLATIGEYLEGEVLPNVSGTLRYHTLVAANLVKMMQRESEHYPAAAAREVGRLQALLGVDEPDLGELNRMLAERLLGTEEIGPAFEAACWEVLHESALAKLAINKPGYDSYDMAGEVG